jgi:hypothetical protein
MLDKAGTLHDITHLRAYVRFSSCSRARRPAVDGWRCANSYTVNLQSRLHCKLQKKNTIKTDSLYGLFKLYIPKTNFQGTSQHVRTASGVTRMIISNVMIGASTWLMRPVPNNRAGHVWRRLQKTVLPSLYRTLNCFRCGLTLTGE